MHKKPEPSMKITVEESNNNGNDHRRKDNMTYILPGEGDVIHYNNFIQHTAANILTYSKAQSLLFQMDFFQI